MAENPGHPLQYAKEHPDSIVRDLHIWSNRPGLLAHAILGAAEHADLGTLPDLQDVLLSEYIEHKYSVIQEAACHATHTMAVRLPDQYLDWAMSVLVDVPEHAHPEVVLVREQLLEDLRENPPTEMGTDGMDIVISDNVQAFQNRAIGTKVIDRNGFMSGVREGILRHDPGNDRAPGQHFIQLNDYTGTVSAGVGRKTSNPDDYVVRMYRGQPSLFLKRKHAANVESLAVVVYTVEAYLNDPDVRGTERENLVREGTTHVLVAVLGFAGPQAPLSPWRLVHNLSGGNNEVSQWTKSDIIEQAAASMEYWSSWEVVSD